MTGLQFGEVEVMGGHDPVVVFILFYFILCTSFGMVAKWEGQELEGLVPDLGSSFPRSEYPFLQIGNEHL